MLNIEKIKQGLKDHFQIKRIAAKRFKELLEQAIEQIEPEGIDDEQDTFDVLNVMLRLWAVDTENKTANEPNEESEFLNALIFVSVAQKREGTLQQQFCRIENGMITASNGVLTAGAPITEEFQDFPHTFSFIDALAVCGRNFSMTQVSDCEICVNTGNLKVRVESVTSEHLDFYEPDANVFPIGNEIKKVLKDLSGLVVDNAPSAAYASVLVQENTAVATNNSIVVESWHGYNLPKMLIPKIAAKVIGGIKKTLVGFGFSGSSATFWFEDESFIKTQLFNENYVNYSKVFDCFHKYSFEKIPESFHSGIASVIPFCKKNNFYFKGASVISDIDDKKATSFDFNIGFESFGLGIKNYNLIKNLIANISFDKEKQVLFFTDEKPTLRGAIGVISTEK